MSTNRNIVHLKIGCEDIITVHCVLEYFQTKFHTFDTNYYYWILFLLIHCCSSPVTLYTNVKSLYWTLCTEPYSKLPVLCVTVYHFLRLHTIPAPQVSNAFASVNKKNKKKLVKNYSLSLHYALGKFTKLKGILSLIISPYNWSPTSHKAENASIEKGTSDSKSYSRLLLNIRMSSNIIKLWINSVTWTHMWWLHTSNSTSTL